MLEYRVNWTDWNAAEHSWEELQEDAWPQSIPAWRNWICSCGSFIKKVLPCFCCRFASLAAAPPPPRSSSSSLQLSFHIWEPLAMLNVRLLYTPTPNAWGPTGKRVIINHPTGVCIYMFEGGDQRKKVDIWVINSTFSLRIVFSSAGRVFSGWSWGGIRLLPPAILAWWENCGCGSDWHLAHLCVIRLPVLPPGLCCSVSGLLLCSQVSYH